MDKLLWPAAVPLKLNCKLEQAVSKGSVRAPPMLRAKLNRLVVVWLIAGVAVITLLELVARSYSRKWCVARHPRCQKKKRSSTTKQKLVLQSATVRTTDF